VFFPHIIGNLFNGNSNKIKFEKEYPNCKGVLMTSALSIYKKILAQFKGNNKKSIISLCAFPNGLINSGKGFQNHTTILIVEKENNKNKSKYFK